MTAVNGITSSWHGPRLATCPSNSVNVTVPPKTQPVNIYDRCKARYEGLSTR
jgi:hypothetical protein